VTGWKRIAPLPIATRCRDDDSAMDLDGGVASERDVLSCER
jgi:hypothetical protein